MLHISEVANINRSRLEKAEPKITSNVTRLRVDLDQVKLIDKFDNLDELAIDIPEDVDINKYEEIITNIYVPRLVILFDAVDKDEFIQPVNFSRLPYILPKRYEEMDYINIGFFVRINNADNSFEYFDYPGYETLLNDFEERYRFLRNHDASQFTIFTNSTRFYREEKKGATLEPLPFSKYGDYAMLSTLYQTPHVNMSFMSKYPEFRIKEWKGPTFMTYDGTTMDRFISLFKAIANHRDRDLIIVKYRPYTSLFSSQGWQTVVKELSTILPILITDIGAVSRDVMTYLGRNQLIDVEYSRELIAYYRPVVEESVLLEYYGSEMERYYPEV